MRTVPVIVVIIVLILGGSFTTSRYLHTTSQTLVTQLEQVEQSISTQKWDNALKELNTALQGWNKNKTWWSVLLDHQEIDNIDMSINRLEKYIQTHDITLSLAEVSVLKLTIEHISETDKLSLQNIL